MIDEEGNNLGILKREEALKLAQEKGLDLIEISTKAQPPVARIISFDKFRYLEAKKEKKQKKAQKTKKLKQVRITPRAAKNDLQIKASLVDKFLKNGYRVEIDIVTKGRESLNKEWNLQKLEEFLAMIKEPYRRLTEIKQVSRGYLIQIEKK